MADLTQMGAGPARRGYEEFECEGEEIMWQRCEITDCPNCICMGMSTSLCYPHGIEFGAFTEAQFEENRRLKTCANDNR